METLHWGILHVCFISSQLNKPQIFPCSSAGKESACNAEAPVLSLGQEDPLEKGTVTHSSILAWRIPWTEKLGRQQSTGLQRVRHDWETSTFLVDEKKMLNFSLKILKVWLLRNLVENLGCICLALFLLVNYLQIILSFSFTNSSYICLHDTEALGP